MYYRCQIPLCDTDDPAYNPDWLRSAVPFNTEIDEPQKCIKYHHSVQKTNGTDTFIDGICSPKTFDTNSKEKCDVWVFGETERTIVNDVILTINSISSPL